MHEKESLLKRLSILDIDDLEIAVRRDTMTRLKSYLDAEKVVGNSRVQIMLDRDPDNVTMDRIDNYLTTISGMRAAIRKAAELGKATDDDVREIFASQSVASSVNLARYLLGFARRVHDDDVLDNPVPNSGGSGS